MDTHFTEDQKFEQKLIRLILIIILIAMAILSVLILLLEKSFIGFISIPFVLLIFILFQIMSLETRITQDSLYYRFYPIQIKPRCINKSEILNIRVAKYSPIKEYGGWGIRFGRSGKAYTMSGNMGISITNSSGKNVLIGTRQPEEAAKFLKENGYPIREELNISDPK